MIIKQGLQGLGGVSWLDDKQRQVSPWGREESAQELKGETCGAGALSTGTGAQSWRVRQGPLGDPAAGGSVFTHNAKGRYPRPGGRRQPTRLPRPWDSPGKNTGVGLAFLGTCFTDLQRDRGYHQRPPLTIGRTELTCPQNSESRCLILSPAAANRGPNRKILSSLRWETSPMSLHATDAVTGPGHASQPCP